MRVSVIIPAKNEERSIGEVIKKVKRYAWEVLVVDGHSKDRTREIAHKTGAKVILDGGLGKGEAIRRAVRESRGEILVFIDADGSHEPRDIPFLVNPIEKGEADLVIASRMLGGSDELSGTMEKTLRLLGTLLINFLIRLRFGKKLTDSQNGFRAIKKEVIEKLDLKENITTVEQEMVIKVLKKNYKIKEVPSHEYARKFGNSKVSLLRDSWCYIFSLIRYLYFPF